MRQQLFKISKKTAYHLSVWLAAALSAVLAVGYSKLTSYVQHFYSTISTDHFHLALALTAPAFMLSVFVVERFAPDAKGSGIPQVIKEIEKSKTDAKAGGLWSSPLVSLKTAFIKVISSCIALCGGASIGREGPTVQITASTFAWFGGRSQRFFPHIDVQSYLTAGAAAGVAAAFNTPLAGIAFALEEISGGVFTHFKNITIIAVVVAGITAQAIIGDYLYFPHLNVNEPKLVVIPEALLIALIGGVLGGGFARLMVSFKFPAVLNKGWRKAAVCGLVCALVAFISRGETAGSGYEITRKALEPASINDMSLLFPLLKMVATLFSYLSGMAGGIFSPSLSIGGSIGLVTAQLFHFVNFKTCSLIGMVAFFSGAIQAPLTAVIIVMEMSDERSLILIFMMTAYLAQAVGRRIMPVPLYKQLALQYRSGGSNQAAN
jgi:H+/Cl- antiporter ClcA